MRAATRERGGILWKGLTLFTLLSFAGAVYLLRRPLLTEAAGLFIVDEKLQPADALIVLGDDNTAGERAKHAARLYQEHWAPRVVASGRYLRPYASIAELIRRDLQQYGVPDEHIIAASHAAGNTREEAYEMRTLAREQRWRRLIVVTSNYHTSRSRFIFRRTMGPDVQVLVSAAPDSGFDPATWWHARGGIKTFARELFAWPVAIWEMWGDQNESAPAAANPAPAHR